MISERKYDLNCHGRPKTLNENTLQQRFISLYLNRIHPKGYTKETETAQQ